MEKSSSILQNRISLNGFIESGLEENNLRGGGGGGAGGGHFLGIVR